MLPELKNIHQDSSPLDVLEALGEILNNTTAADYLQKAGKSELFSSLIGSMESPAMLSIISTQWPFETTGGWANRLLSESIKQTALHSLAAARETAELHLRGQSDDLFEDMSPEQVQAFMEDSEVLGQLFTTVLS